MGLYDDKGTYFDFGVNLQKAFKRTDWHHVGIVCEASNGR